MPTERPKRIHLINSGSARFEEHRAAEAITPGMLLELDANGEVVTHITANGPSEKMFALEDALQGNTIADAYADNDLVFCILAAPGDVIYAILELGANVAIGAQLASAGDGTLQAISAGESVVAIALEAVDASSSTLAETIADRRIRVRIV